MNSYVNAFQCFSNNEQSEFIIHFCQDSPITDESNEKVSIEREQIASLVMSKTLALQLVEKITEMIHE